MRRHRVSVGVSVPFSPGLSQRVASPLLTWQNDPLERVEAVRSGLEIVLGVKTLAGSNPASSALCTALTPGTLIMSARRSHLRLPRWSGRPTLRHSPLRQALLSADFILPPSSEPPVIA